MIKNCKNVEFFGVREDIDIVNIYTTWVLAGQGIFIHKTLKLAYWYLSMKGFFTNILGEKSPEKTTPMASWGVLKLAIKTFELKKKPHEILFCRIQGKKLLHYDTAFLFSPMHDKTKRICNSSSTSKMEWWVIICMTQ